MLSGGIGMGQLIKLQNYTSRYEQNIFHYPSRFVMLKKQQWDKWQRELGSIKRACHLDQAASNTDGK